MPCRVRTAGPGRLRPGSVLAAALAAGMGIGVSGCGDGADERPAHAPSTGAMTPDAGAGRAVPPSAEPTAGTAGTLPVPLRPQDIDPDTRSRMASLRARIEADPRDGHAWLDLGRLFHAAREFDAAARCYAESDALLGDAGSAYLRALVLERLARRDEAVPLLRAAIQRDPNLSTARWHLTTAYLESGDIVHAMAEARRAVAARPDDPVAPILLARGLLQNEQVAEATAVLEDFIRVRPGDRRARWLLGVAYRAQGRHEDAAREQALGRGAGADDWPDPLLDSVRRLVTPDRAALVAALELLRSGRVDEAIVALQAVVRTDDRDLDAQINLGMALRRALRMDEAIEVLERAVRINGTHEMAHFHLAGAWRQKAMPRADVRPDVAMLQQALVHVDDVIRLKPTFAAGHGLRGEILTLMIRLDEALESYAVASRLEDANPLWPNRRGTILLALGRPEMAALEFRLQGARAPMDAQARLLEGTAWLRAGRLDDATAAIDQGLSLAPQDTALRALQSQVDAARAAPSAGAPGG